MPRGSHDRNRIPKARRAYRYRNDQQVYFHLDLQGNTGRKMRQARLFQGDLNPDTVEYDIDDNGDGTQSETAG